MKMKRSVFALFVAFALVITTLSAVGAPPASAASTVSNSPQQLAQALVSAHNSGAFTTDPTTIYDREIVPVSQGQTLGGCAVDVRVLQVLVLVINRFGSLRVSDLQRPCIGSNLNCGPPTYSVHCVVPGEAIDFANVGGVGLNGSNAQNILLLQFLDNVVPNGTNAGQSQCRTAAGNSLNLANIDQFADSCNHQHVDFRNTDASLNPTVLGAPLPTVTASSSYVVALYNDYLSRTPSAGETKGWATQLANGAPRDGVANGFVNSDEYRLIRIAAAYQSVLGRSPDPSGPQNWLAAMHRGSITTDDIETSFYSSLEYFQQHGNNNAGFVASLYTNLLHRNAGSDEIAYWVTYINKYGTAWVVSQFWRSTETISERISAMYQRYLGRAPDPVGLNTWVGLALQIGDSGLRSALTSSDEYFARSQNRYPSS
ncbi:DUF4214 domain-containing protein [Subtercola sp. RTI3]|uniref:DUF4214 domain-containing protein n=1 Tax=Subtercola sp. RTI3 TaxID=3048639 RepID=UPI002B239CAE|nr:DUF4214 domain-containing protein [Subtercola sp. RTI3]MEA9984791.1 DUF4214 domain-containing protein [Subtercola sp. RTI3]